MSDLADEQTAAPQGTQEPSQGLVVAALVFAVIALGLSTYLSIQSLSGSAVAGCGGGSGCDEVLSSAWSRVGPVPVALLGGLVQLAVVVALIARLRMKKASRLGDTVLLGCAAAMPGAAAWLMVVQASHIGAYCPYCIADHAAGVVLSVLLFVLMLGRSAVNPLLPLALGAVAAGGLIAVQVAFPSHGEVASVANPFVDEDGDTVIDGRRYVSVFGGDIRFTLDEQPYIGSPDAEQVVVVGFDYGCKYCRKTHMLMDEMIRHDPKRFVMVALPMTIDERHNPYVTDESPVFDDSLQRALLSLAVAKIDREKWLVFDRWLFAVDEPDAFPRSAAAANAKAQELVGMDALNKHLTGESLEAYLDTLRENVELFADMPFESRRIPITTTPGAPAHITERFTDPQVLYDLLDAAKAKLDSETPQPTE